MVLPAKIGPADTYQRPTLFYCTLRICARNRSRYGSDSEARLPAARVWGVRAADLST
jgi:hypothetical protein